jgi:hypothetical protein
MLINAILMVASVASAHAQAPTSKALIEKMLGRYYTANSLVGKVRLTVAAENATATLDTELQYEKPAKVYIHQQKNVADPDPTRPTSWLVTSDGVKFTYDAPNLTNGQKRTRLREDVLDPRTGKPNDVKMIYAVVRPTLGDFSMPLDIAFAHPANLNYRRGQWINHSVTGTTEIRGKMAYLVAGAYRISQGEPESGKYQMAITADGDLLQYVERIVVGVNGKNVEIVSQWDVDLTVNGTVNAALFKLIN